MINVKLSGELSMAKAIILMMDSFGIGGAPDAADFANDGAATLQHIAQNYKGLQIPNLLALGLGKAAEQACAEKLIIAPQKKAKLNLPCKYGHAKEISRDKDTVSGHWEMAGLPNLQGWGHFKPDYPSFPEKMIAQIVNESGIKGILGNKAASGTVIIQELGEEHLRSGKPIFYTSADSNLQIAAHEEVFGLERLYKLCEIAYKYVKPYNIGRVIARPFVGAKNGEFVRTTKRKDYAAQPFGETLLDRLSANGVTVVGIGAINDIYAHKGISKEVHAAKLPQLFDATLAEIAQAPENSLIFTNFEDFDMYYGHRRDVNGYAQALEYFDARLPEIVKYLNDDDIVFITADHGNDPTWEGTDHTREQVPVLMFGKKVKTGNLGQRGTYADIAATVCEYFNLPPMKYGVSFLHEGE